ncbi:hypothetical protein HA402_006583 [Bradysia odoriphaga]|nr:hypothetical protein HA402_006583 [Bradysia odoriphaga]
MALPSTMSFNTFVEQQFAMEPQDQVAVVGARVILPCRVVNKQGVLQWTKDDFGLGTRRKLVGFDRYQMIGSDEEGDYSLQIYPVTLDDNAQFQCQVSPGPHGHPGVRSRYATLSVLVAPDAPVITQGSNLVTTEGREISLECISANGRPPAEITWIDGFGNVLTENVELVQEPSPDMRRFTVKSILKLKPYKEYHNKTIICQAQNTVDKAYRTAQVRLEIEFAPKVQVLLVDGALDTGRIPEGNIVSFMCEADANPNELTYRWFLNDEVMPDQNSKIMNLFNVTRDYQNFIVKCVAQNAVGISSDSETLDVIYQPTFIKRPTNVEADIDEIVYLYCEVDANPPSEIIWVFDPIDRVYYNTEFRFSAIGRPVKFPNHFQINLQPRVVDVSNKLEIIASSQTSGRYFCKANSPGFQEIQAEATVTIKGPPKIVSSNQQYAHSNQQFDDIECSVHSIPKAKHISWAFNGKLIDINNDLRFSLREEVLDDGIKSILTIMENNFDYFGKYSCIVINSYGSDTLEIEFGEPRKYSMIILGVGSALILIILVCGLFIIIFCMKINKKALPPADLIPKQQSIIIKGSPTKKAVQTKTFETKPEPPSEYQESNSGSYSTTTTLSINKTDLMASKTNSLYSGNYTDNLSIHTNQSINGGASYVDYARDYYSPTIQNSNNYLLQLQRESPTYV